MNLFILLFTTSFIYIEIGLILPVIFPLIIDPSTGFLPLEVSKEVRGFYMGGLIGATALARFFSLPLLGAWSDRIGRKKALQGALLILIMGTLLGLGAIIMRSVSLLLLSRILDGIGAANYAIAQGSIADTYQDARKTKNFALLNSSCGIGFVLGPLIGSRISLFANYVPYVVAFILSSINLLLVLCFFKESRLSFKGRKIDPLSALRKCLNAFRLPQMRMFFVMILSFCLGWGFFCECMPLFLMNRFQFGSLELGRYYIYSGIMITFCQGIGIRPFANRFSSKQLVIGGLSALVCTVPCLLLMHSTSLFYMMLFPIILFQTLVFPSAATFLSDMSEKGEQGEVLGFYQSLQAMGMALGPLFLGSLTASIPALPILGGAIAPAIALGFAFIYKPLATNRL
ncbi:MAG: Tetracycline resistance protein, class C [Chlamydiales bacterium]|nr:Tetracycline resistance protein, class C [Chlamydiales bacterium]MCH9620004.1 Tetracycline resistance protein, class C [Chlamydiales bacterium]MCH9622892.1 Tetracycline resistance protein, class C [Chlamydiales bacterium]